MQRVRTTRYSSKMLQPQGALWDRCSSVFCANGYNRKSDSGCNDFYLSQSTSNTFLSHFTMQPRRVTIVSSPSSSTKTLPGIGIASPASRGTGPVYRIEERSRTIYVSSDVDPKDWDTHSLNTILSLADPPDGDQLSAEPVRRSRSHVEREIIITPEPDVPLSPHDQPASSRTSILFSRKPVVKSSSAPNSTPSSPTRRSPQRASRPQILFYNKEDPFYGFTNFSAHPVIYKGKRYPTSEHLFQSFKVCISLR